MPKYCSMIFLALLLFGPVLTGQENTEKPKKPAGDSYREPYEVWGNYYNDEKVAPDGITGQYVKITVSPAAFPDPLLKYRLNVFSTEQKSGNAAPLYMEAIAKYRFVFNKAMQTVYESDEYRKLDPAKDSLAIEQMKFRYFPLYPAWSDHIYVEITPEDETRLYESLQPVYEYLQKASLRRECDWSDYFEFRGIATLLEHVQDSRLLARYLGGKANWEIRNGKYDEAVKTIRIGIALGNHLQKSDPASGLVTVLVGISIQGIMYQQITILSSQPDAPNLYPALSQIYIASDANLHALYSEHMWLFPRAFPKDIFDTIDQASAGECRTVLLDLLKTFGDAGTGTISEEGISTAASAVCLATYPHGKERLLKRGMSEEEIDSLSTYQVVTPYIIEEIGRTYNELFVIASFPIGESHTAIKFDEERLMNYTNPVKILLNLLVPVVQAAQMAHCRQQQTLDRMKTVEAIRYYAYSHDGELPESLEAIKEVPVPKTDPCSGKPYVYKREGKTAIIDYTYLNPSQMEITVE